MSAKAIALHAAFVIASLGITAEALGQNSTVLAPGRVEGAGPALSIGVAAAGVVSEILAQPGSPVHSGDVLVRFSCQPLEADLRSREAHLRALQATFDRVKNGPRPDEIRVGEAVVNFSQAKADEAQKTLERTEALQEGVTVSAARILEVKRDARIAAAQLAEARARLSLLRAGSREEDIRQAEAARDTAAADVETGRARLEQCSIRAPVNGTVLDVLANPGQYFSSAVPQPLLHIIPDGALRVRAEVELRDVPRICATQTASVSAEASPSTAIRAQVAAISPAASSRSIATATADARNKDILAVDLSLDPSAPPLPISSAVMVRFDACPPKGSEASVRP
jgi:multidrug resistance efflux pump